ncbi:uncharacterized protein PHALS_03357 [Plasmopara halstedii]|uniref:Uncharacterized protein n=1 Tax=Plasmopara halstedii TaxID=4781 RepID=A0A0P1A8T9_PLAHL|nr:uncharacterized protein PHALS_03357 [Plasmopara halstedii]CEG36689.1 hypothetical protein PHALS_03357 [Plasmopara halstedii]|eukprot:XP_024573058.1 hypothetical protein PHALS_03357 [Plasmopara halstedii]
MFDYISNINAIEQFSWVLKRGTDVDDGTQKERAPCLLRVCLRGLADENVHGHRITVGWNTNSSTECPKQLDTLSKLMLMYDPEGREQGGQKLQTYIAAMAADKDKNDTSTKGEQDLKQLAVFPAQKLPVSEFIWDATNATSTLASSHETLLRKWQLNEGSVEAQEKLELDVLMMA